MLVAAFGTLATVAMVKTQKPVVAVASPVSVTPAPQEKTVSPAPSFLQNGDMEAGTNAPTGWESVWTGEGKLQTVRDSQTKSGGAASLRCESVGAKPAYGSVSQDLVGIAPGQKLFVSVRGRAEGKLDEAYIALQVFQPAFKKQLAFDAIANKSHLLGQVDFTTQSREITLPNEPCVARVVVLLKGTGKIWADDISVTATK